MNRKWIFSDFAKLMGWKREISHKKCEWRMQDDKQFEIPLIELFFLFRKEPICQKSAEIFIIDKRKVKSIAIKINRGFLTRDICRLSSEDLWKWEKKVFPCCINQAKNTCSTLSVQMFSNVSRDYMPSWPAIWGCFILLKLQFPPGSSLKLFFTRRYFFGEYFFL